MASVFDVARYILGAAGPMSAMKLQKLVYYCQAWALVWDDEPLFNEVIEAWTNGPVAPDLYAVHKGKFTVTATDIDGDVSNLSIDNRDTIDSVLRAYGGKSAQWLSAQTHTEEPWLTARAGLSDNDRGQSEITLESMSEYYSAIS